MSKLLHLLKWISSSLVCVFLVSCATTGSNNTSYSYNNGYSNYDFDSEGNFKPVTDNPRFNQDYASRLPEYTDTEGSKMVLVDPNQHVWGAYGADGHLIRAGIATAGSPVCPPDAVGEFDCRTNSGTFHITSMRGADCISKKYPEPKGGGLMPYCMYFNGGQALHGSPDNIVMEDNLSHGCVRMRIPDAEWLQNNFANIGTKVVVEPYS